MIARAATVDTNRGCKALTPQIESSFQYKVHSVTTVYRSKGWRENLILREPPRLAPQTRSDDITHYLELKSTGRNAGTTDNTIG